MKKRILSIALCLCMVLSLLPAMALAADDITVFLGSMPMSAAAGTSSYWKSGDSSASSAEISGWNAKFELVNSVPTLTLRDADITGIAFSADMLNIVASGENTVAGSVTSNGSLNISGSGKLTVSASSGTAISADDIVITGSELEVAAVAASSTTVTVSCGIKASGNISIDGAKVTATGGDMSEKTIGVSCGIYVSGTRISFTNGARVTAKGGNGDRVLGRSAGIQLYHTDSDDEVALCFADAQVSAVGASAYSSYGISAAIYEKFSPISLSVSGGGLIAQCEPTTDHGGIYLENNSGENEFHKTVTLSDGAHVGTNSIQFSDSASALTVNTGCTLITETAGNAGTFTNNGTIVLPTAYAPKDIPAAIKAMGLTGTGKVTVNGTAYSNVGGKVLGALAFTDTASEAGSLDTDGYHYELINGVGTLTLKNAAVISTGASGISFEKGDSAKMFEIVLVGQNSVSVNNSTESECSGICSNAGLTISGDGTLDVSALSAYNGGDCYGIWTTDEGDLTINADVTASAAASGDTVKETHHYGICVGGDLTVGASRTVNAAAGNADWGSEGIFVKGNLSLENGAVATVSSGDTTSGYSTGVYGEAELTLGEGARLSATAGKALNSSNRNYNSTGVWLTDDGAHLEAGAILEATGADTEGEGARSYGLYIYGLAVGEGASVTAKSGSAETTYGISNYGDNITVTGGTVTAAAGDTTGTDSSYSYGIDVTNGDIRVSGTGTVDAAGGKAADSIGIELSQGSFYDYHLNKITEYYDNGKLAVSGSAKVTAKSGDPASTYPGSVGLICTGLSLSDSASLDASGVNYGIRAAGFSGKDENGDDTLSPSAISVSGSASLSAAAKSAASLGFGLQGCAAVDVSGGAAKFAGKTAAVYLYGEGSNLTAGSGLTAITTPAGGTLRSALITAGNTAVSYKSYTADAALTISGKSYTPTNACTAVTIAKAAPAAPAASGDTSTTTTNPDGSTTTVVTKPDGGTSTTVKQPDGVTTVTNADKNGSVTGVTVTVPDTVKGDVSVSIPADLGKTSGAVSAVVTYPDGTKKTVVGTYSDGRINLNVGGSAAVEILGDFVPLASLPLTDVPSGAYYDDAVIWAAMTGVTGGKTADTFAPDGACTRAETVTFLWRAMGSPEPTSAACPFADVSKDAYYCKAVLWAVEKGITKGVGAAAFRPNAAVTRAQVVTFLWRAAGSPAAAAANPFTDVGSGLYYTDAVVWAVSQKIALGTTAATYSPAQTCTRAQMVTFLWRQLGK